MMMMIMNSGKEWPSFPLKATKKIPANTSSGPSQAMPLVQRLSTELASVLTQAAPARLTPIRYWERRAKKAG